MTAGRLSRARAGKSPGCRSLSAGLLGGACLLLAACSLGPSQRANEAVYDFGPPPQPAARSLPRTYQVDDAAAPAWIDLPALQYRLAYASPAQLRPYASSRWAASPAALFTQRLRLRLAQASRGAFAPAEGVRADVSLTVEITEFVQVFDRADASRGVLRLRATANMQGRPAVQRLFEVDSKAPSADAAGGAAALSAASDEAIRRILAWLSE